MLNLVVRLTLIQVVLVDQVVEEAIQEVQVGLEILQTLLLLKDKMVELVLREDKL